MINQEELSGVKTENGMKLQEDMLIGIMFYVPVKSLLRFKCVSKYWCALIKRPAFAARYVGRDCMETMLVHRYITPQNSKSTRQGGEHIFSFHNPNSPELLLSPNLSIPFFCDKNVAEFVKLFGPCNGLVCLIFDDIINICNPALREFKMLATSPFTYPDGYIAYTLGSGFGFDASTNSFKVVRILNIEENAANFFEWDVNFHERPEDSYGRIDLFNSSTDSWRLIEALLPDIVYNPGFDLYFNGACHWQARLIDRIPSIDLILSFDMSKDIFQQFEYPHWFEDEKRPSLVVLNQCLAVVRLKDWLDESHFMDIWVMKEYGVKESWTKELVIGPYHFKRPLLSWKNERLLVETNDGQLAICAIHGNEFKIFPFHGLEDSFRALILTESLIRLDHVTKDNLVHGKTAKLGQ